MTPERALEIVSAINDRCFYKMELVDKVGSLEGVSLDEMVRAARIVKAVNARAEKNDEGFRTIHVIPDDRLIAAAYVLEHYQPDRDAIAIVPHGGWGYDLRAVAVVGLERTVEGECRVA